MSQKNIEIVCTKNPNNKFKNLIVGETYTATEKDDFYFISRNDKTLRYAKKYFEPIKKEKTKIDLIKDKIFTINYNIVNEIMQYTITIKNSNLKNYSINFRLNFNDSNISCGIAELTGLNIIINTFNNINIQALKMIEDYKKTLSETEEIINTSEEIDDYITSILSNSIAEYFEKEVFEKIKGAFVLLSTNLNQEHSISEILFDYLDSICDSKSEEKNPNSGNPIAIWVVNILKNKESQEKIEVEAEHA